MLACWHPEQNERPLFSQLAHAIKNALKAVRADELRDIGACLNGELTAQVRRMTRTRSMRRPKKAQADLDDGGDGEGTASATTATPTAITVPNEGSGAAVSPQQPLLGNDAADVTAWGDSREPVFEELVMSMAMAQGSGQSRVRVVSMSNALDPLTARDSVCARGMATKGRVRARGKTAKERRASRASRAASVMMKVEEDIAIAADGRASVVQMAVPQEGMQVEVATEAVQKGSGGNADDADTDVITTFTADLPFMAGRQDVSARAADLPAQSGNSGEKPAYRPLCLLLHGGFS